MYRNGGSDMAACYSILVSSNNEHRYVGDVLDRYN